MMRLGRRASLLVTLALLTSAATASAECAWVLWEEEQMSPIVSPQWTVVHPHVSANACSAVKAHYLRSLGKEDGARIEGNIVKFNDREQRFRVLCLPDTVDPRGK
jgi:hypothetical protein